VWSKLGVRVDWLSGMNSVNVVAGHTRMKRNIYGVCFKFRMKEQLHWWTPIVSIFFRLQFDIVAIFRYIKRSPDWDLNPILRYKLPLIKRMTVLQVAVYIYAGLNALFGFLPLGNCGCVIDFNTSNRKTYIGIFMFCLSCWMSLNSVLRQENVA
jgi:hypothetical protein